MPSTTTKDAYLSNSSGLSVDYSLPITGFRKGWDGKGHYLSLNMGGQYNFIGSANPSAELPNGFAIAGQTASNIAYRGGAPAQPGFKMGIGPQANFNLGNKFTISPMVLAEYFSMTQKELSAVQTTQYNGQTYEKALWTLPETKTSGLAITPKVRMQYKITNSLGLFADASYILGPKIQTQISTLVPTGPPNQEGFYEPDFVNNGTYVKGETKSASYSAFGANVGLSFAFGKPRKGWNGVTESEYKGWNGVTENSNSNKTTNSCNCITSTTSKATLSVMNGTLSNYLSNSTTSPTIVPTITIPFGTTNFTGTIQFGYAGLTCSCTTGTLTPRTDIRIYNPSAGPYYLGATGTVNYTIPNTVGTITGLPLGINTVIVYGDCNGSASACAIGSFKFNIVAAPPTPPTVITLVKKCCTILHGLHAGAFTGQVSFTMGGTTASSAVLEITSPSGVVYEPFVPGNSTACYSLPYTVKLLDASHVPFATTTINGLATNTISNSRSFDPSCRIVRNIDLNVLGIAAYLPHNPKLTVDWATASTIDLSELMVEDPEGHRLSSTFTNPKTKEVVSVKSIVEILENGDMNLIKIESASSTLNGVTNPIQFIQPKKHEYVGHVTLLR